MGAESYTFFRQLAQAGKAHDLETAGISQNRLIPIHKPMQAAHFFDQISTGAEHQVISIAQQNLRARCRHGFRKHCLDRTTGTDRHKSRRINRTVFGMQFAKTGFSRFF